MDNNLYKHTKGYLAVVLDFDGVIVDSEDHWGGVENPYIKKHTSKWRDEDYGQLTGMGLSEVHKLLVTKYDFPLSEQQYFNDYEELALTLYSEVAKPIKGVEQFLEHLKASDLKIAIASSSRPTWINIALKRHGLRGYFSRIVSSHDPDVSNGKPAPDVYVKAARELLVATDKIIVIEDSTNGIRAAKSAGTFCIGLNINGQNIQDLSQADLIVTSYDELTEFI